MKTEQVFKLKHKSKIYNLYPIFKNNKLHHISFKLKPMFKVRKTLLATIKATTKVDLTKEAIKYFAWFDKQVKCRGLAGGLHRHKITQHTALRYMLRQDNPQHDYLAVDKDGFPKCIKYLKKHTNTPQGIQAVSSLINYYRILVLPGVTPDFSSITKEGTSISDILIDEVLSSVPKSWHFDAAKLKAPKIDYRSKKGPNGHATFCAAEDLQALLKDPDLYDALKDYLNEANGEEVVDTLEELEEELVDSGKTLVHSRINIKREGGGKARPFAIPDYWTQTAVKPLHDQIFNILKKIPEDCTFDQDLGIPTIKSWTRLSTKDIFCFDIQSATDRWPVEYQERLLEHISGSSSLADAWRRLMTNRAFKYKKKAYLWQVGQPLGALSSWGIFSISHHLIVLAAFKRAKLIDPSLQLHYYLLGDDIAIKGKIHAQCYLELVDSLGVKIQLNKTIVGDSAEFCKRHFFRGTEVSPIPINLISSVCRSPLLINSLIGLVNQRKSIAGPIRTASFESIIKTVSNNNYSLSNNLRILATNPITGQVRGIANLGWSNTNGTKIEPKDYQTLYSLTKYEYLARQYSLLQRGQEEFIKALEQITLPGIHPDHAYELHPYTTSLLRKYDLAKANSHKSMGKFWSQRTISKDVLPNIPRLSVRSLNVSYRQQVKHSAKIILLFYKKVKTLVNWVNKDQSKRLTLIVGLLENRALLRNYKVRNINKLCSTSLKSSASDLPRDRVGLS